MGIETMCMPWETLGFDFEPSIDRIADEPASLPIERNWTWRQRRDAGQQVASYFKNSIPMVLAYAGFIGVGTIALFGADYDFPGAAVHEADKPNAEYWAGMLHGCFGTNIRVSQRTTFMSTNKGREAYGYGARQPMDELV